MVSALESQERVNYGKAGEVRIDSRIRAHHRSVAAIHLRHPLLPMQYSLSAAKGTEPACCEHEGQENIRTHIQGRLKLFNNHTSGQSFELPISVIDLQRSTSLENVFSG
jgi:hypothetical protein